MIRLLPLTLAFLTACSGAFIPPPAGSWTTTTHGVTVVWRYTEPNALRNHYAGVAFGLPITGCDVALDPVRSRKALVKVAAHEFGHCAQAAYLLPGISRPDLGEYYSSGIEGFAETYALAYLAACGDSLEPLGWPDYVQPTCAEAPDPRLITAVMP